MKSKPILFKGRLVRAILADRKTQTRRIIKAPTTATVNFLESMSAVVWRDNPQPTQVAPGMVAAATAEDMVYCPYGEPGRGRLWIREAGWMDAEKRHFAYAATPGICHDVEGGVIVDEVIQGMPEEDFRLAMKGKPGWKPTPSIHMPRWASRITLDVVGLRVERIQDISEEDAIAEGIQAKPMNLPGSTDLLIKTPSEIYVGAEGKWFETAREAFASLWDSVNAAPKPRMRDGVIDHYVSYPFEGESKTVEYRGRPWHIRANPHVWCVSFRRLDASKP